ncbi:MAG: helix-turn-helix transcriptional regulator [Clostridia bacterium]|nr:helix-turn-helix transcriptional regulator [Clostridia bacterium]
MKLNFADNLRTMRTANHLTQERLAEILGVSVQTVSRWETRTSYPDVELLPVLAELFGVTVDELLGVTAALREQRKQEEWSRVYEVVGKDTAETVRLLRQMRRDYPTDPQIAQWLCSQIGWLAPDIAPDEMRELRSAAEWLLTNFQDNAVREEAIFGPCVLNIHKKLKKSNTRTKVA